MSYSTKVRRLQGGDALEVDTGGSLSVAAGGLVDGPLVLNTRLRVTTAQVNAGHTLLAARAGFKYRLVDVTLIAVGGAAAGADSVDISSTQTSAVKLVTALVAALAQHAVVKPNSANVSVLNDGASFVANDAGAAVTIGKTGAGALATATHIDVILSYVVEKA